MFIAIAVRFGTGLDSIAVKRYVIFTSTPVMNQIPKKCGQQGGGGCPLQGTDDDPYILANLNDNAPKKGPCLEGNTPDNFNGDRSRTLDFLEEKL